MAKKVSTKVVDEEKVSNEEVVDKEKAEDIIDTDSEEKAVKVEMPKVKVPAIVKEDAERKVKVKFLRDLDPRIYIGGSWVGGKKDEVALLTPFQASTLRKDNTVI